MNEISSEYTSDRATKNGQVSENEHMLQKNTLYVSCLLYTSPSPRDRG